MWPQPLSLKTYFPWSETREEEKRKVHAKREMEEVGRRGRKIT